VLFVQALAWPLPHAERSPPRLALLRCPPRRANATSNARARRRAPLSPAAPAPDETEHRAQHLAHLLGGRRPDQELPGDGVEILRRRAGGDDLPWGHDGASGPGAAGNAAKLEPQRGSCRAAGRVPPRRRPPRGARDPKEAVTTTKGMAGKGLAWLMRKMRK
jgi:hypothetical protein